MAHLIFTASRQIRLLNLRPGTVTEDLNSETSVVSLDELPQYDALSYAWEANETVKSHELPVKDHITCNDRVVPISPNLGRALQYLRDRDCIRRLWIDKLCINQNDFTEREQQIQYMWEIFSGATDVVVWLGDSDEHTDTVWSLLQNLRSLRYFGPPQMYHLAFGWKAEQRDSPHDDDPMCGQMAPTLPPELARLPPGDHPSWKAVDAFLDRTWFARLWTLQEVVVCNRCRVVCGEFTMSWEDICAAAVALQSCSYGHFMGPGGASIIFRDGERTRWQLGQRTPLRDLLSFTRSFAFNTRYPHDRIFGLLSLIRSNCASRLSVQYARPLSDLFSDVARACIAEDKSLAVLAEVDIRPDRGCDMSSWVPDWCKSSPTAVNFNAWSSEQQLYRCAGQHEPMIQSSVSVDTLIVRGFLVAPITRILRLHSRLNLRDTSIRQKDLSSIRWAPEIWDRLYTRAATTSWLPASVVKKPECMDPLSPHRQHLGSDMDLTPVEMLQIALRRTLTGDLYPRQEGRLPDSSIRYHFPAYAAWEQRQFSGPPPPQVLWEHDCMVQSTMSNRKGFLADDDNNIFLCVGLKTLREGDWVVVLLGGDTPFILRPMQNAENDDASSVTEWSLVSECYVHGLMDGEAMARTQEPDFKYKDFILPAPIMTARL